jgi:aminopeptidase N
MRNANTQPHLRSARLLILVAGWAAAGLGVSSAIARPDTDGDGHEHGVPYATGRVDIPNVHSSKGTPHQPPANVVDFKHMRLDLTIADMNRPKLVGIETLTFAPLGDSVSSFDLDARLLTINVVSAQVGGVDRPVTFTHNERSLTVRFDPPLTTGQQAQVVIHYEANDPPLGLIWSPQRGDRPAQLHPQGQPETNSYWFPCHDFPNEKLTTEVMVTVPTGYLACSNGRLVAHGNRVVAVDTEDGGTELRPFETFHWLQDKPHVNYLVSLVVGKFDVVDVGTKTLAMPVYVPPGRGKDVAATFGRTAEMIGVFEHAFGEPYPWDKYAQLVVWNFGAGGMENTSATTLFDTAVIEPSALFDHNQEGLISHELAHQWFGDLLTCNSWEHIWLNEGFATYASALWTEFRVPAGSEAPGDSGRDGYDRHVLGSFDNLCANDKPDSPATPGMVSNVYAHPWETFRRAANPYGKGASVLHMLRRRVGDEVFFRAIRQYVHDHKFQTVETDDLRRVFESASGEELSTFFAQWCTRTGVPKVELEVVWQSDLHSVSITGKQTQKIDAANPPFEFSLPVWVRTPKGSVRTSEIKFLSGVAAANVEIATDSEPEIVAINHNLAVLADLTIKQPRERWLAQLASGPTLASRVQAARALRGDASDKSADALRRAALVRTLPTSLRVEAVKTLKERDLLKDVISIGNSATDRWDVRSAAAEAVGDLLAPAESKHSIGARDEAGTLLTNLAKKDPSIRVRSAAIKALAKGKAAGASSVARAVLRMESQSDELRQAGLEALGTLDRAEDMLPVLELTRDGVDARTRALATTTLGKIGHHDKDRVFEELSKLLDDRQIRTRRAAGEALVELADRRALDRFSELAASTKAEEIQTLVADWIESLNKKLAPASPPDKK